MFNSVKAEMNLKECVQHVFYLLSSLLRYKLCFLSSGTPFLATHCSQAYKDTSSFSWLQIQAWFSQLVTPHLNNWNNWRMHEIGSASLLRCAFSHLWLHLFVVWCVFFPTLSYFLWTFQYYNTAYICEKAWFPTTVILQSQLFIRNKTFCSFLKGNSIYPWLRNIWLWKNIFIIKNICLLSLIWNLSF